MTAKKFAKNKVNMDFFLLGVFMFFLCSFIIFSAGGALEHKKRMRLMDKYNNKELVDKLMSKMIWQGQTEEQLLDSIGQPSYICQRDGQSKILTYKYTTRPCGRIQTVSLPFPDFNVTIVDGTVVASDRKQWPT
ncbi:DUF2845 domain-containing protein [Vibrio hyugaensis]|uniref:DUF2845 domain-containing protein n=1 Tax=Vibrio hyugaensis TaxID=1534743 RepID=UPI001CA5DAF6|nr:DUF2845 domain-containing protein [Vibrio hyugaensis]